MDNKSRESARLWKPSQPTLSERVARLAISAVPPVMQPAVRELRYRLVGGRDVAALQDEIHDLQSQWEAIVARTPPSGVEPVETGPHVLFVTGFGLGTHAATREPILMMALRRRGCRISSLFCDATLPACEFNRTGNHIPDPGSLSEGLTDEAKLATCRRCASNVRSTYSVLDIELHPYHEYVTSADLEAARVATEGVRFEDFRSFEYEGVAVGDEVFASVLRITFRGTVEDTPLHRTLVKRYLLSGVVMARVAEAAYKALRPDRIVMAHGVYLTHGIAAKVARKLGIPVITYRGGDRRHTFILSHNETYHRTLVTESNEPWEHVELTPEQRERTLRYTFQKQRAGVDAFNYHPTPLEDVDNLYRTLGIDRSRPLVSLFTNVIWDAQIFYDGLAFRDILDWMRFSIQELARNKEVWAVIRVHPAEAKGALPTNQPIIGEIQKWFPQLPENVRIVPPESNLSSYTLAEQSRATIIYGTKMGLELAVRGIPVLICGETFSRNKGYGIDISSRDEYAALLARIQHLDRLDDATVERAVRYAHYLYFRRFIDFPYVYMGEDKADPRKRLAFSSLADLDRGLDPKLDAICDTVMRLHPAYLPAQVA